MQACSIDYNAICATACSIFNIPSVHGFQIDVCKAILEGSDCILDVPTGVGKTLAFWLPLLHFWQPGITAAHSQKMVLVISPLTALMQSQATELNKTGIPAVAICAETLAASPGNLLKEFASGNIRKLTSTIKALLEWKSGSKLAITQSPLSECAIVVKVPKCQSVKVPKLKSTVIAGNLSSDLLAV
ncbi:hypothetical protein BD410DRAFT_809883 [Rickenella mellea]|uniref:DNA 3'-5' helicase n=1 Tax=Rickenella mellea TaxID=50990 RepID=A0A4Y7PIK6_9AGAM|nr:hypothetical protein BD410DRAFT_809883 [Rickenella mellea]